MIGKPLLHCGQFPDELEECIRAGPLQVAPGLANKYANGSTDETISTQITQ
jgi:hypothetical protein